MRTRFRSCDHPIEHLATHPAEYVTVAVAASFLELDPRTVIVMIRNGDLCGTRVGREWRIFTASLQQKFLYRPTVSRSTTSSRI